MHTIDEIRRHPTNQHTANLLRQANQSPSESPLPVFQLMQWGMESGEIEIQPKYRVDLEAAVAAACRNPDQKTPFQFLTLETGKSGVGD